MRRVAFAPAAPLLLPGYAGRVDPLPDLRVACHEAVAWLVLDRPARVLVLGDGPTDADRARGVTTGFAERVGSALLAAVGYEGEATFADPATGPDVDGAPAVLVLANGSARRGDEAPGYVDERAFGVDEVLVKALADGDTAPLAAADPVLGAELMAAGTSALNAVAAAAHDVRASLLYEGDPLGVQYWVATWECG